MANDTSNWPSVRKKYVVPKGKTMYYDPHMKQMVPVVNKAKRRRKMQIKKRMA
jgi:hypothetical protein|tara:strand:- start:47 stop:205 length:159 start_codon:yes stop_codon:yes gene_type:complete